MQVVRFLTKEEASRKDTLVECSLELDQMHKEIQKYAMSNTTRSGIVGKLNKNPFSKKLKDEFGSK